MKIELKMDYNDVKVLRELCNVTKTKSNKEYNLIFKWDMVNGLLIVHATNSYVFNTVEFGKKYYPKFIIDDAVRDNEYTYAVVVKPEHMLVTVREILKHKKSTVDETCKLVLESAEGNVGRLIETEGESYQTMDNLYFDFQFDEGSHLNMYKIPPRTQRNDYTWIHAVDSLLDNFVRDLMERTKLNGVEYLNVTPDVMFVDVEQYAIATKIMNMNDDMRATKIRYVKNNLYLWKECMSDDNVKNKEAIVMLMKHNTTGEQLLTKYLSKVEKVKA